LALSTENPVTVQAVVVSKCFYGTDGILEKSSRYTPFTR